jgi:hypothetical protein
MLQRDGRWLMQLRDEIPTIVAPGCWGLFGGHLDPGETPEQALRRELLEGQDIALRSRDAAQGPIWSTNWRPAQRASGKVPRPALFSDLCAGPEVSFGVPHAGGVSGYGCQRQDESQASGIANAVAPRWIAVLLSPLWLLIPQPS